MVRATAAPPRMTSSKTSRAQPETFTGALPDRLGSSTTLKIPQALTAISTTSTTTIYLVDSLARLEATMPIPTNAAISRPKRSTRFQGAIFGGCIEKA